MFLLPALPPSPLHSCPFSVHVAHILAGHDSPAPSLRRSSPLPGHASPTPSLRRWCPVPLSPYRPSPFGGQDRVRALFLALTEAAQVGRPAHVDPRDCPAQSLQEGRPRFQPARERLVQTATHLAPRSLNCIETLRAARKVRQEPDTFGSVPSLLSGPYRASRGSSLGATVATPLGMGWTLGTGISPRGPPWVARGEVPKVLDCSTTASFWMPFRYPFLGPTGTQFYLKS